MLVEEHDQRRRLARQRDQLALPTEGVLQALTEGVEVESNEWKEETRKSPAITQAPRIDATAGQYPFIMYSEVDDVIAPIFTELQPIVEARATAVGVARRVLDALSERGAELSQIPALTTDGQWQQAAVG